MASKELEELIEKWEWEADNDGMPPKLTEPQKQELAREYLLAMERKKKIHGLPVIGMSIENHRQLEEVDRRIRHTYFFLCEALNDGAFTPYEVVNRYIAQVRANDRTAQKAVEQKTIDSARMASF